MSSKNKKVRTRTLSKAGPSGIIHNQSTSKTTTTRPPPEYDDIQKSVKSTIESMEETLNRVNDRRRLRNKLAKQYSGPVGSNGNGNVKERSRGETKEKVADDAHSQATKWKEQNAPASSSSSSSLKQRKNLGSANKTKVSRSLARPRPRKRLPTSTSTSTSQNRRATKQEAVKAAKTNKVQGQSDVGGNNTKASQNATTANSRKGGGGHNIKESEIVTRKGKGKGKGKKDLRARMDETRKRREKLEKERLEHLEGNSGMMRQKRLKKRSLEEKLKLKSVNYWLISVVLGARVQLAIDMIEKFRAYKRQLHLEDTSARIITRQLRMHRFRRYRKRVQVAMLVITRAFLVKIRLWKRSRKRVACDRIRAFLLALEEEAKISGGCLALIVKGKKWRAYRIKIINLQRIWRGRLSITSAQALLVDLQWQREQQTRTDCLVERLFKEGEEKAAVENERIDNINRTRKLIKLKSLPKFRNDTRYEIRERLMKGTDLLSVDHICPAIFRTQIIREFLINLRRFHLEKIQQYNEAMMNYEEVAEEAQRRRAVLIRFSGNQSSGRSVFDMEQQPIRPFLKVILRMKALDMLLSIGSDYVKNVRHSWMPRTMTISPFSFDGVKEAALIQINDTEQPGTV